MVTGASTADLSIVLVDARNGVSEQTRRHAYIASLLRIPHLVVCVNKMDLVDYDEAVFYGILDELTDWAARLEIPDITFIPISALHGDNVVDRSDDDALVRRRAAALPPRARGIAPDRNLSDVRFPVQWVIRPMSHEHHDYRGYAGQVAGGVLRPGDEVVVLPSGQRTDRRDRHLRGPGRGGVPDDVGDPASRGRDRHLPRRHDRRGRGPAGRPRARGDRLLDERAAAARRRGRYAIKHTTRAAPAIVDEIEHRVDVNTLDHEPAERARAQRDRPRALRCSRR